MGVTSSLAKNQNEKIRIPISRSKASNSEHFMKDKKIRIQQIAFETNDIFVATNAIQNKELALPIPKNYYSDLNSKSLLTNELIDKMEASNILYDRQETGEFFHFYLKEIDGLFFEIVQRKGNYHRFGKVNAQIRLTAQERYRKTNLALFIKSPKTKVPGLLN
jgi:4-hydroxyphenylpyruvate dioxygenase